jgi:RNA polymerase sigma factor (sigma-70 family)
MRRRAEIFAAGLVPRLSPRHASAGPCRVYGWQRRRVRQESSVAAQALTSSTDEPIEPILVAIAGGDRAALRSLYEGEAPRMLGVALRLLKRRDLAEEAVQDAFIRIWQHAGTFDPKRGSGRSWLYAILRHRALNILRGESRTELVDDFEPFGLESPDVSPEDWVTHLSDAGALRRCLERIEPTRRKALLLAYTEGLSHGELAGRLGVPLGTMKSWIRRSLIALRECMA